MAKCKVSDHILVPTHTVISDKDKEALLKQYNIELKDLPKILVKDPALDDLKAKVSDVIKIERPSPTAGIAAFFRRVSDA